MAHLDRIRAVFRSSLNLAPDAEVDGLAYRAIPQWDSLAHMTLVAALEDEFDIMIDTDDVLDLSSFDKAVALLEKHGVVTAG
ncbi:acyl carrier protein [Thermocatellispora tengchongensis]|uniref:Acyl carrier protein n=1 Tax=Thermocatellispora tengchongensis TaxID=1073253 RepID=A0A840PD50_9ACTN|nr:acyl carrier protein [Thermocatellispora tengchongensis]MBB5139344.1 acyl carrier protein [Thermocatellispora tengchongensis]